MAEGVTHGRVGSSFDDFLKDQGVYDETVIQGANRVKEYKSERNIQAQILMALSEAGCLVWRQNTGAYVDPKTKMLIRYGLCVGSSDVIGLAPEGRFLAVEVKTATGAVRKGQPEFIAAVRRAGGYAGIARSVEDALAIARGEIRD